jgi:hypothetical protein
LYCPDQGLQDGSELKEIEMRDANLIGTADTGISSDSFATDALEVDNTGEKGVWVQFVVTRNDADADETLQIRVFAKDSDASWDILTDDLVGGAGILEDGDIANGETVVRYALVQTKHTYIKAHYDVEGTSPDYDVTYSIVSGPSRDHVA